MNNLLLFTDGACKGNRNVEQVVHPAGWGVVAVLAPRPGDDDGLQGTVVAELCGPVLLDPSHDKYFGATLGSNNTAELTAMGEAFNWLAHRCQEVGADGGGGFADVVIRYDSMYAAKSVTGEYNGAKNKALIVRVRESYARAQAALRSMRERRGMVSAEQGIRFLHVKGHSGHRWNERADLLANMGLTHSIRPGGGLSTDCEDSLQASSVHADPLVSPLGCSLKLRSALDSLHQFSMLAPPTMTPLIYRNRSRVNKLGFKWFDSIHRYRIFDSGGKNSSSAVVGRTRSPSMTFLGTVLSKKFFRKRNTALLSSAIILSTSYQLA